MKGSLNSLLSGNITGAVGLAMGANFLGAGSLIKGGYGLAKALPGNYPSANRQPRPSLSPSKQASLRQKRRLSGFRQQQQRPGRRPPPLRLACLPDTNRPERTSGVVLI
ncbi:MAG: hypothetical protein AB9917_00005 [Negativicutes bacterium]